MMYLKNLPLMRRRCRDVEDTGDEMLHDALDVVEDAGGGVLHDVTDKEMVP